MADGYFVDLVGALHDNAQLCNRRQCALEMPSCNKSSKRKTMFIHVARFPTFEFFDSGVAKTV